MALSRVFALDSLLRRIINASMSFSLDIDRQLWEIDENLKRAELTLTLIAAPEGAQPAA